MLHGFDFFGASREDLIELLQFLVIFSGQLLTVLLHELTSFVALQFHSGVELRDLVVFLGGALELLAHFSYF